MKNTISSPLGAILAATVLSASVSAQSVTVAIDGNVGAPNGVQVGAGATNPTKDNLVAENSTLWGVSNSSNVAGLIYFSYSDLAGTTLPPTIQAGTYKFEARIGNGDAFDFVGLNDLTTGINTEGGSVAGFFTTLAGTATGAGAVAQAAANDSKNNMYTEFNSIAGVTYTAPAEPAPEDLEWTTWTFIWEIAPGSPVIGSNPYFAVYTKTGGNGAGFWDDSTLKYSASGVFPSISSLTADPGGLGSGDPVTLRWSSMNASILTLDPGGIDVSGQTSAVVNLTATTVYTLTASDGVNSDSADIEIVVGPQINSFTADLQEVESGDPVTLSWDVSNAGSLTLDPGNIDVLGTGSIIVSPSAPTTYTLMAWTTAPTILTSLSLRA
ncbi:hypothetical protein ACFQY0_08070 [Haloferula chungangensis]|uniref:Uncharacterized protein n=1 Tax=Haloferula chungangensis TaxID=1048331 RepID=A0ABW2L6G1_9BACT